MLTLKNRMVRFLVVCLLMVCAVVVVVVIAPQPVRAQTRSAETAQKETFTGTIIGIGGAFAGRSRSFTLTLNGTTSDADFNAYVGVLAEKRQDGLLAAINKQKLGSFALTGQIGRDVNVVRIRRTETGRRITIIFERWLNLFEVRYGTRSEDYPFTYAELYIDAQGKGQGTLIPAARIRFDKEEQTVEIENFGIYPARLAGIQSR